MRKIKFRAWDSEEKNYIFFDALGGILAECDEVYRQRCVDKFEQFTGLRDKNGKEIYEGDIVQSKNHNPDKMEIRFIEGGFCAWWGNDDYPIDINQFYDSLGCCIEVIGNIHENPELLE